MEMDFHQATSFQTS